MGYKTSHWFFSNCPQTSSILFSAASFAPQKLASAQLPCRLDCCLGLANGRRNWKFRVEESGWVFLPHSLWLWYPLWKQWITRSPAAPTEAYSRWASVTLLPTCALSALSSNGFLGWLVSGSLVILRSYSDIVHTSVIAPFIWTIKIKFSFLTHLRACRCP